MPLLKRMHKLHELFHIRVGPGAAVLPRDVSRIHLSFSQTFGNGHMGPRKFWRDHLPRLKFHNPGVSMTVERHQSTEAESVPASMTVYFNSASSTLSPSEMLKAGEPGGSKKGNSPDEGRQETVDIQHKRSEEIFEQLLGITKAEVIQPTEEDQAESRRLEQEAIEKAIDSKKKKAVMMKLREEARIQQMMVEAAKAAA